MKRPLIALSSRYFLLCLWLWSSAPRTSVPPIPPSRLAWLDPTATSTPTATATATTIPTASPTPRATPTVTPAGLPPRLVQFQPINTILTSRFQPITLTFSQNMDQASVAAALTFSPTVPFTT
ncbi:MAG: hypothetical protein IPL78_23175 [Chloroflexi bacterium]|nr:hypothetical protein [Chloroflexota bacterium]